jgi:hypothetical protein
MSVRSTNERRPRTEAASYKIMTEDEIIEVGIDTSGSLYVCPRTQTFPHIYRAAMGVRWDEDHRRLFCPKPVEWSYAMWFAQILAASASEYRVRLVLSPMTAWSLPAELRSDIENQIQKGPS